MPETNVPAPGLDWLAFQKRNKPPPLVYWSEVRPPRASKYKSAPVLADRDKLTAAPIAKKKRKKYNNRTNVKKVRLLDPICRYCMTVPTTTADHVFPKSRGGSSRLVNLVGCCWTCNQLKNNMTPKEAGMTLHLPLRFFSYPKEAASGEANTTS